MRNIYFVSIVAGILSVPLFFIILFPVAFSQQGADGTSETFENLVCASLIALTGCLGCMFVAMVAQRSVSFSFGLHTILLQVLFGLALFGVLLLVRQLLLAILPQDVLFNPNGSDSTTQQTIGWLAILIPLVFQHVLFWRTAILLDSRKKAS